MEGMYNEGSKDVMVAWLANFKGATPLHEAAFNGNFAVVRALCKSKADPTLTNGRGITPVQLALDRGLNHIAAELEVHIRTRLNNIEYFPPNFEGLVLGCIDADFCK